MKETNHFHNEYQKYSFFLYFPKDLTSRNVDNKTTAFLNFFKNSKKMKKLRPLASDFEKCRKEKILNSTNLSNMIRGTLSLKDCDIASYPCWNYAPSNLLF